MNKVIVVRHGEYGVDRHLTEAGRSSMVRLAEKLSSVVDDQGRVVIFTSPADRARESAEILGTVLGVKVEEHGILLPDKHRPEDLPGVFCLVTSHKKEAEILVVVTHGEYAQTLPSYLAGVEMGIFHDPVSIGKGEAQIVDFSQKTIVHMGA